MLLLIINILFKLESMFDLLIYSSNNNINDESGNTYFSSKEVSSFFENINNISLLY